MKLYSTYKDSGQPWLGLIPEHWETRRLKYLVRNINEQKSSKATDETYIALEHIEGGTGRLTAPEQDIIFESNVKCFCKQDVLFSKLRPYLAKVVLPDQNGVCVGELLVLRSGHEISPKFLQYALLSKPVIDAITGSTFGAKMPRADWGFIGNMQFQVPKCAEQAAVVAYLDHKTADIERFITKKRQLIAMLTEQKAAIINRAVTKGMDSGIPMKASGVEWLGEVPAHWEVRRLRFLAALNPSKSFSTNGRSLEEQVVFLPMENISVEGKIDNGTKKQVFEVSSGFTFFGRGDVIIAKITPCFENGKGAWLDSLETDIGFGTTELIVLRPHNNVWAQFLYFVTASSAFRTQGEAMMTGSAGQQRVPTDFVRDYPVALPPFSEQKDITKFIEAEKAKVNEAISRIEREIELIQEYRTTLISEAVTGKIDVREAAKNLIT